MATRSESLDQLVAAETEESSQEHNVCEHSEFSRSGQEFRDASSRRRLLCGEERVWAPLLSVMVASLPALLFGCTLGFPSPVLLNLTELDREEFRFDTLLSDLFSVSWFKIDPEGVKWVASHPPLWSAVASQPPHAQHSLALSATHLVRFLDQPWHNNYYAPINVKPHYPPCGTHRGIDGDLHFRFIKSPPTGRVQNKQSPANQQEELTVLKKNVAKICLCHARSTTM